MDHSDYRQEQFGATLGGPLIKDRLFYFVSVERYRKQDENDVSIDPVLALPAIAAQGFQVENGSLGYEETQTSALLKLDYLQDEDNKWGFRFSYGDRSNENQIPWGGIIAESAGGILDGRNSQVAVSHQWLGSTSWMNECRVMYATEDSTLSSMDPFGSVSVDIAGVAQFGTQRLTPQNTSTDHLQFADTATFFLGPHTLKAGMDLLHSDNRGTVDQNMAGVYSFQELPGFFPGSLAAFNAGFPAAYLQSWGNPTTSFKTRSDALFLQDDWQLSPRFLLKLGLRYDQESLPGFDQSPYYDLQHPGPGDRLPDGVHPYSQLFSTQSDWSSSRLSPRLSFSWQAEEPVRLYGGYGVFSGSTQLGALFGPRLYNNRDTQTVLYTFLDDLPRILTSQLPNLPVYWATGPAQAVPPSDAKPVLVIPGSYGMPETKAWNLGMEWLAGPSHRFTLDLLYTRGYGFMNARDVNAYVADPITGLPRRPDQRYSEVLRVDGSGESRYWGQTVGWQWKVNEDVALELSYTHGKAEDNYTDWNPDFPPQNTYDPSAEWGPSAEDQTNQVKLTGLFRSRSTHPWLRNWTVAVSAQYASGRPYSQLVGYDQNLNGEGSSDRPTGVGRNRERGPDIKTVDLRLAREVALAGTRVEFLLEVFNLFNAANVLEVQNVLSAPAPHAYGTVLQYGPMRQFQFGLRVSF
jgi:outer membrane receptor protein involved in Fe transport